MKVPQHTADQMWQFFSRRNFLSREDMGLISKPEYEALRRREIPFSKKRHRYLSAFMDGWLMAHNGPAVKKAIEAFYSRGEAEPDA